MFEKPTRCRCCKTRFWPSQPRKYCSRACFEIHTAGRVRSAPDEAPYLRDTPKPTAAEARLLARADHDPRFEKSANDVLTRYKSLVREARERYLKTLPDDKQSGDDERATRRRKQ